MTRPHRARRPLRATLTALVALLLAGAGLLSAPLAAQAFTEPQVDFSFTCTQGGLETKITVDVTLEDDENPPTVELAIDGAVQPWEPSTVDANGHWEYQSFGATSGEWTATYDVTVGGELVGSQQFTMPADCQTSTDDEITVTSTCIGDQASVTATVDPVVGEGDQLTLTPSAYNYATGQTVPFGTPQTLGAPGGTVDFTGILQAGVYDITIDYASTSVGGGVSATVHVPDCAPDPNPTPTPIVTPSVAVACVDGTPIATVDLDVTSVPSVATRNSVDGGWDIGVYDVLNYQPLQADKPIVYNISPGTYTFTGPVPVGSFQWFIDSNDYIVGEFTIAAGACPTPTPSATPAASLSSSNTAPGQTVTVTASGLVENEPVEIWLHSTPVMLWNGSASADGSLTQTVTIPAGTEIGNHQIEVRGATSGSLWLNLTVSERLAATGFDAATAGVTGGVSALLLACGIGALWVARRKGEFRVHD